MHANQRMLNHFYAAFARLDAEAMANCYAPDARFRRRGVFIAWP